MSAARPDQRRFDSLDEALRVKGIPLENYELIHRFTTHVGIEGYYDRGDVIKAIRKGSGPDLNIAYGWSNGFTSEEEARAATGEDAPIWHSGRGSTLWGVSHPVHALRDGNGENSGKSAPRDYGVCPECFLALPASGVCGCGS